MLNKKTRMPTLIFIQMVLITSNLSAGYLLSTNALTSTNDKPSYFAIEVNAVRVPLGRVILARRGGEYYSVMVHSYREVGQEQFAEYEVCLLGPIFGEQCRRQVSSTKKGSLSNKKSFGIGRFSFGRGNVDIAFRSLRLMWSGDAWLYFYSSKQDEGDYGYELAPTNWRNFRDIDLCDKRLIWYKYDARRKAITIPEDRFWTSSSS